MTVGIPVDVVVLSWNDGVLLDVAMASARASEGIAVNLIVVDNGSDVVPSLLDGGGTLLANPVNRGVATARNQGVQAGTAPFVLLLDSDARLEPGTVAALLRPLLAEPEIGVSVPTMTDQSPEATAGRAPTVGRKLARLVGATSDYGAVGDRSLPWWDVDFGIGACQLFRRVAWEGVGGIDESFFYGPEDVDFCLRLRRRGWRVVQVAGARVEHPARRRFRNPLSRRGLAHAWAVTRFLWRHRRPTR